MKALFKIAVMALALVMFPILPPAFGASNKRQTPAPAPVCISSEAIAKASAQADAKEVGRYEGVRLAQFRKLMEDEALSFDDKVDLVLVWRKSDDRLLMKVFLLSKNCAIGAAWAHPKLLDDMKPDTI